MATEKKELADIILQLDEKLGQAVETIGQRLSSLENRVSSVQANLVDNTNAIGSFRQDVSSMKDELSSLEHQVSSVRTKLGDNTDAIDSFRLDVSSMKEDLDAVGALTARNRISQVEMFERLTWRDNAARFGVSALIPNQGISENAMNPDENEGEVPHHSWS